MTTPATSGTRGMGSGLSFKPTVEEQVLLGTVQTKNSLILYTRPTTLSRLLALFTVYFLGTKEGGKVFILTKRNLQTGLESELRSLLPPRYRPTLVNGSILPHARQQDYHYSQVIVATPRTFKNDLKDGLVSTDQVKLVHIDPADMGAGSRTLRWICEQMVQNNIRLVGFTQLTQRVRLRRVCENLGLDDIIPHEQTLTGPTRPNIQHYSLPLPKEYYFLLEILNEIRKFELNDLEQRGYIASKSSHKEVVTLHDTLKEGIQEGKTLLQTGNLLRIFTLQTIVVGKGFEAALAYLGDLKKKLQDPKNFPGKQTISEFLHDPKIRHIQDFLETHRNLQHPKIHMLLKLVREHTGLIVVISPNVSIAAYLASFLKSHAIPTLHIPELIAQLPVIKLKQRLARIQKFPTRVCIANTVTMVLAEQAALIIAYEVSASVMERLDRWKGDIPRVFLLSKQTTEEKRFFQLKNLGRPRNGS